MGNAQGNVRVGAGQGPFDDDPELAAFAAEEYRIRRLENELQDARAKLASDRAHFKAKFSRMQEDRYAEMSPADLRREAEEILERTRGNVPTERRSPPHYHLPAREDERFG